MSTRSALAQLRLDAGYSSAKGAARKLDISHVHLANIERGSTGASDDLSQRMSVLYRVSLKRVLEEMAAARASYHERMLSA